VAHVNVSGPQDQINRIKPGGDFPACATLKINSDDPIGRQISRPLEYTMPPGVFVKREDSDKAFDFTLKKANSGANQ
jgi:hypothetical protein